MREYLKNLIVNRYNRGCDEVCIYDWQISEVNYRMLLGGQISIEAYLDSLTDEQMVQSFDSQCCQIYR